MSETIYDKESFENAERTRQEMLSLLKSGSAQEIANFFIRVYGIYPKVAQMIEHTSWFYETHKNYKNIIQAIALV